MQRHDGKYPHLSKERHNGKYPHLSKERHDDKQESQLLSDDEQGE